jgi:outer membrane murein-binding lipoprotein Lpp
MNGTDKTIETLSRTTEELLLRSEISSILDSIVSDIEIAQQLEQQINHDRLVSYWAKRCERAEEALEEYKAVEQMKISERQKVGEEFLKELHAFEGQMKTWSVCQEEKESIHTDGVTEGEIPQDEAHEYIPSETSNNGHQEEHTLIHTQDVELMEPFSNDPGSKTPLNNSLNPEPLSKTKNNRTYADVERKDPQKETINEPQTESDRISKSITTKPNTSLKLPALQSKILVSIFEFLEPIEIVITAQANKRLYSKVNGIFGLEGAVYVDGSIEEDEEVYAQKDEDVVIVEDEAEESSDFKGQQTASKATIVSIPSRRQTQDNTTSKTNAKQSLATTNNNTSSSSLEKSLSDMKSPTASISGGRPVGFQMSAAVAKSLTTKLTPNELSAIITMRDQLRQKEDEVYKSKKELDDIRSQLEGTLAVNDVLTEEVKNIKKTLDDDRAVSAEITRQAVSDQEVIAFLDERVQELEKQIDYLEKERKQVNATIEKAKNENEKQVTVLTELLTYEREQKADQERDWKNDKKILVKEVKKCRSQILSLEAERDGLQQENQKLREALLSFGSAATRNKSFDGVYN